MADPGLDPSKGQEGDGSWCRQGFLQVGLIFHHSSLNNIKAREAQQRYEHVIKATQKSRCLTAFP